MFSTIMNLIGALMGVVIGLYCAFHILVYDQLALTPNQMIVALFLCLFSVVGGAVLAINEWREKDEP